MASPLVALANLDYHDAGVPRSRVAEPGAPESADAASLHGLIAELEKRMKDAATRLEFEEAARLRDRIRELRRQELMG